MRDLRRRMFFKRVNKMNVSGGLAMADAQKIKVGIEDTAARVGRLVEEAERDRPLARHKGDVVHSVELITPQWLTEVLCEDHPGAAATGVRVETVSSGTHARHRLHITYNDAGAAAGLPPTVFTKSLPDVETRMIAGITGHARTEGRFYMTMRPELGDLEVPRMDFIPFLTGRVWRRCICWKIWRRPRMRPSPISKPM